MVLQEALVELYAAYPSSRREIQRVIRDVADAFGLRVDEERLREPSGVVEALVEAALELVPRGLPEAERRQRARRLASRVLFLALDTIAMEFAVACL